MTTKLQNPPSDCISRVRFSPAQGPQLLVSSWDAFIRLYDARSGQLTGLRKQNCAILDCTFLWDGTKAFSGGLDKRLVAWDLHSQQELQLGVHDEAIRCVEAHAPTRQVFTGSWDRSVRAWDPRQPAAPTAIVKMGTKAFCLDVGVDRLVVGGSDRHVHIYDLRSLGRPLERRESSLKHQLRSLQICMGQRGYVSSSVEGRVALEYFDSQDNDQLRYAFKCHRTKGEDGSERVHPVNSIAVHPVHGTFATGGSDGGVCVWDGAAKKRLWRLNPFDTSVSSLCFSSDGSMLAIGVSYTLDNGDLPSVPPPELAVRAITQAEVMPKVRIGG